MLHRSGVVWRMVCFYETRFSSACFRVPRCHFFIQSYQIRAYHSFFFWRVQISRSLIFFIINRKKGKRQREREFHLVFWSFDFSETFSTATAATIPPLITGPVDQCFMKGFFRENRKKYFPLCNHKPESWSKVPKKSTQKYIYAQFKRYSSVLNHALKMRRFAHVRLSVKNLIFLSFTEQIWVKTRLRILS